MIPRASEEKDIQWVGSSYADLLAFPKAPRREAGFQLRKVRAGLEPTDWRPFEEVGAGTREIRISDAKGIFRVRYVAMRKRFTSCTASRRRHRPRRSRQGHRHGTLSRRGQCKKGQAMTIDTEIRHVTKAGANLFLELGFTAGTGRKYAMDMGVR